MSILITAHAGLAMEVLRRPFSPVETSVLHYVMALGAGLPKVIQWRWIECAAGKTDTGVRLSGQRLIRDGVLRRVLQNTSGTRGGRHIPQTLSVWLDTGDWKGRSPLNPGLQDQVALFQEVRSSGRYETSCPSCGHKQSLILAPERRGASCTECGFSADADTLLQMLLEAEKSEARVRG